MGKGFSLGLGRVGRKKVQEMINIPRVVEMESSNNPLAYNLDTGATGLMQITEICLKDYNRYHSVKFTMKDMDLPGPNMEVGIWYMNTRIPQLLQSKGVPDTDITRLIAFNAGASVARSVWLKIPKETRNYLIRYFKEDCEKIK